MRRWRATWTRCDWVGAGTARRRRGARVLAPSWAATRRSGRRRRRSGRTGSSTTASGPPGALAIGLGVLPLVAALAACPAARELARRRAARVRRRHGRRHSSRSAGTRRSRRLPVDDLLEPRRGAEPDLPRAAALRRHRARALRGATCAGASARAGDRVVLYLVTPTPTSIDSFPYYEAHGLAILALPQPRARAGRRADRARASSSLALAVAARPAGARGPSAAGARGRALVAAVAVLVARLEPDGGDLRCARASTTSRRGWRATWPTRPTGSTGRPAAARVSASASRSPTRTANLADSSSGTARSRRSGAPTARRPGRGRR